MARIPNTVHFVFGLREQTQPFHILHYLAIESARKVLTPNRIVLYYHHLPYGLFWDLIRPQLQLVRVPLVDAVNRAGYDDATVPEKYRYAHHSDFIRLDALIESGGIYADIDTLFLRPMPDSMFEHSFVIGRESAVLVEQKGALEPSLCNAFMMSERNAPFALAWRDCMESELNGSWSKHSCQLAQKLAVQNPGQVHVEQESSFMGVPLTPEGLASFLKGPEINLDKAYSVHWWEHVWWEEQRQDFSNCHAGMMTLDYLRTGSAPICRLARPFLPDVDLDDIGALGA